MKPINNFHIYYLCMLIPVLCCKYIKPSTLISHGTLCSSKNYVILRHRNVFDERIPSVVSCNDTSTLNKIITLPYGSIELNIIDSLRAFFVVDSSDSLFDNSFDVSVHIDFIDKESISSVVCMNPFGQFYFPYEKKFKVNKCLYTYI